MPVTNLITPVDPAGIYPAVPAGSNRLLFVTITAIQGAAINANSPTSVTIGGVNATFVAGDAPGFAQLRAASSTWVVRETQIPAMSGSAIVVIGANGSSVRQIAWALKDANQNTISRIANGYVATGPISMPLTRAADSWTALFAAVVIAEDITLTNPARTSRLFNVNIGYAADTARTANSTTQTKTYIQTAHVINVEPAPVYQILSVNDGDGVNIGSTGNVALTAGFSAPVTSGTIGGEPIVVTSYDAGTGEVVFDGPVVVDQESFPHFDSLQTVTFSSASETGTLTLVPLQPPVGSTLVPIVDPENTDPRALGIHIYEAYGFYPATGDELYGVDADVVWQSDLYGSAASLPVTTPVNLRRDSTGLAYVMNVTVNPEGEIVTPVIVSVGDVRIAGTTAVEVEGFAGPVVSGTLDGVALTSASDTSITVKGLVNTQTVPRPGLRPLALTDTDSTATLDVLVGVPTGFEYYTITADFVEAVNGVATTLFPVADAPGDYVIYNPSPVSGKRTRVTDAGVVTNNVGTQVLWLIKDSTKVARSFNVTTTEGAAGAGGGQPANEDILSMQPIRMVGI